MGGKKRREEEAGRRGGNMGGKKRREHGREEEAGRRGGKKRRELIKDVWHTLPGTLRGTKSASGLDTHTPCKGAERTSSVMMQPSAHRSSLLLYPLAPACMRDT